MPLLSPTAGDVHLDKMLTNILLGYRNMAYIADEIFPIVLVDKQTDIIPELVKDFFFRDDAAMIAEGGTAKEVGYKVQKNRTYYCEEWGLKHFISDRVRENQDAPFDADRESVELLTSKMQLRRELAFTSDFWTTGVWTTDVTGGTTVDKWSDYGSSEPIQNIRTYKRTVRRLIGVNPNLLVLGDLTFEILQDHPAFLDRIKYTGTNSQPADVTMNVIAQLFGVDRVLVGNSIRVTTTEQADVTTAHTYSANWDDDALLLYVNPTPSIWEPSAGYTFSWKVSSTAGAGMQWARRWRDDERMGEYLEVRSCFDQKSLVADAGCFFTDICD
jgi:hypothetical protein